MLPLWYLKKWWNLSCSWIIDKDNSVEWYKRLKEFVSFVVDFGTDVDVDVDIFK